MKNKLQVVPVLGLQWGDEGKGKFIDFLVKTKSKKEKLLVARFQGGSNAGHSIFFEDKQIVFHIVPSGILEKNTHNLIGAGVNIDVVSLKKEINEIKSFTPWWHKNLFVSREANIVVPTAKLIEGVEKNRRGFGNIGTTGKGIGPTYSDFYGRTDDLAVYEIEDEKVFKKRYQEIKNSHLKTLSGKYEAKVDEKKLLEAEKIFFDGVKFLRTLNIVSCHNFLTNARNKGRQIIAEGGQGTLLDVRFGTRFDVTSSHTTSAGVCAGLGLPPSTIGNTLGVFKAYATRVGNGPMPTEIGGKESFKWASIKKRKDEENLNYDINDTNSLRQGIAIRAIGKEYGATTGRLRRVAWLDLPLMKYAIALNGITHLGITKIDILDDLKKIPVCVSYKNSTYIDMNKLDKMTPFYKTFPGWKKSTRGCTSYKDLPKEAKTYLKFIEKKLGVPIAFISTGPKREEMIVMKKF